MRGPQTGLHEGSTRSGTGGRSRQRSCVVCPSWSRGTGTSHGGNPSHIYHTKDGITWYVPEKLLIFHCNLHDILITTLHICSRAQEKRLLTP